MLTRVAGAVEPSQQHLRPARSRTGARAGHRGPRRATRVHALSLLLACRKQAYGQLGFLGDNPLQTLGPLADEHRCPSVPQYISRNHAAPEGLADPDCQARGWRALPRVDMASHAQEATGEALPEAHQLQPCLGDSQFDPGRKRYPYLARLPAAPVEELRRRPRGAAEGGDGVFPGGVRRFAAEDRRHTPRTEDLDDDECCLPWFTSTNISMCTNIANIDYKHALNNHMLPHLSMNDLNITRPSEPGVTRYDDLPRAVRAVGPHRPAEEYISSDLNRPPCSTTPTTFIGRAGAHDPSRAPLQLEDLLATLSSSGRVQCASSNHPHAFKAPPRAGGAAELSSDDLEPGAISNEGHTTGSTATSPGCAFPPAVRELFDSVASLHELADVWAPLSSTSDGTSTAVRARGIFPLPYPRFWPVVSTQAAAEDLNSCMAFLRGTVFGLNRLYGVTPSNRQPTLGHWTVWTMLAQKILRLGLRFAARPVDSSPAAALAKLCHVADGDMLGSAAAHPRLVASQVDGLRSSGLVDPLTHVEAETAAVVRSPDLLFPGAHPGLAHYGTINRSDRLEYLKLIASQLRSNKLVLRSSVKGGGTCFCVPKKEPGHLRQVWHGTALSEAARSPPRPPHVATPGGLLYLQTTTDRPYLTSKRDGKALVDQLKVPSALREWFGTPPFRASEMLDAGIISFSELRTFYKGPGAIGGDSTLFPCLAVWPMGFSWSSYLAQCTTLAICKAGGLDLSSILSEDDGCPADVSSAFCVATDDICHFTTKGAAFAENAMAEVDQAFDKLHVLCSTDKNVTAAGSTTCIGVDIDDGLFLVGEARKVQAFLLGTVGMAQHRDSLFLSPNAVAGILGIVSWLAQLNRPLYAVFDRIYQFTGGPFKTTPAAVPVAAIQELAHAALLAPLFEADLTRSWCCDLLATDASDCFGFGACCARVSPDVIHHLSRLGGPQQDHVRLDRPCDAGGGPEKPRTGTQHRLRLSEKRFRVVISSRRCFAAHSGNLEAHGVCLGLEWLLRRRDRHSRRAVMLVDAQAIIGALAKGRTSARSIISPIRKAAALSLAGDLSVHYLYIPSESNPADKPSRGLSAGVPGLKRGGVPGRSRVRKHTVKIDRLLRAELHADVRRHDYIADKCKALEEWSRAQGISAQWDSFLNDL